MHRTTPLTAAFTAYNGGGARALVDAVTDATGMQEMKGSMLFGEVRSKIESPQNYGFTSVVQAAIKDAQGMVKASAEAYLNYIGGNRSFPVALVMDDRRFRPWGLKPGENAQYDDIGQMTLMRRDGLYMVSLDTEERASGGGASAQAFSADTGEPVEGEVPVGPVVYVAEDNKEKKERMVSMRHVSKKTQPRPKGDGSKEGEDHKHEGESVNTEIRCTKGRIEFRAGDKVVGYYDVASEAWYFTGRTIFNEASQQIRDKAPKIDHN